VGGGSIQPGEEYWLVVGRSPRGRGKRHHCHDQIDGRGSIPAWAGEATRCPSPWR